MSLEHQASLHTHLMLGPLCSSSPAGASMLCSALQSFQESGEHFQQF
jgi:hypothetical protein